jgi:hypothetical protein
LEEPKAHGRGGYIMGNLTNEFIKKIIELNNEAVLSMQADCPIYVDSLYK